MSELVWGKICLHYITPNWGGNAVKSYCHFLRKQEIENSLTKFWELEEVDLIMNDEEKVCEAHFIKKHFRNEEGRFVVRIPLKLPREELGNSKELALKRFFNLERKLEKIKL